MYLQPGADHVGPVVHRARPTPAAAPRCLLRRQDLPTLHQSQRHRLRPDAPHQALSSQVVAVAKRLGVRRSCAAFERPLISSTAPDFTHSQESPHSALKSAAGAAHSEDAKRLWLRIRLTRPIFQHYPNDRDRMAIRAGAFARRSRHLLRHGDQLSASVKRPLRLHFLRLNLIKAFVAILLNRGEDQNMRWNRQETWGQEFDANPKGTSLHHDTVQ